MNINFDDGVKTFEINNDPNRVIKFNPSDLNLINRLAEAEKKIKELVEEAKEFKTTSKDTMALFNKLNETEKECREQFNYIFGEEYDHIVFGQQSIFSVSKGKTIMENFVDALLEEVSPILKEEQAKFDKNVSKYKEQYDRDIA